MYTNKVKSRHGIELPTTCGYQNCGKKKGFNGKLLCITSTTKKLVSFFSWTFYHFTCFYITEGYIVSITNYDYDKYFSIAEWEKSGGTCDAKKHNNTKENDIY